ncbi:MAG TPA: ATP-grasp domain-containing protein [Gaiellaceae bacterium]|nr:ATP-grasp domain-containing protein [Gaiellaceae bacterium]
MIAADRDPAALGFVYADRRAIVSAEDEPGIERLADAERVDGIVAPGIDWPVAVAARVAERLGLPHPIDGAAALLATSKLRQRERFREAGVPQPAWELCRSVDEAREATGRIGLPVVVKAPDRQGQRGLGLVRREEELEPAATEALEAARSPIAIVERYDPGREVTVNAFLSGGRFHPLTITDRLVAEPPAFGVALAHVWPSSLEPPVVGAACDAARAAAEALGIAEGPVYVQVLAGANGPEVIELAARLGGGHDAELCRAALGVDLNALALAAALGEEVPERALTPVSRAGGACVRFLVPPPGPLEEVQGVESAQALPGIELVRVYRRPGFVFGPFRRGADRAGAVLAVGASREEALERAAAAVESIRFQVADAPERV